MMFVNTVCFLVIAVFAVFVVLRFPRIVVPLIVCSAIRMVLFLARVGELVIPNTQRDAGTFFDVASFWSQGGFFAALAHFPGATSYFYSWIMSLVFAVVGDFLAIGIALNVCLSILTIGLVYSLARKLWTPSAAVVAAWVVGLWPTSVWFAVSFLREPAIMLIVVYACLCAVRWIEADDFSSGFKAVIALTVGGCLHTGVFIGIPMLLTVSAFAKLSTVRRHWRNASLPATPVIALSIMGLIIGVFVVSGVSLTKIGSIDELTDAEYLEGRFQREKGAATFPSFITQQSGVGMVAVMPARLALFSVGPFAWSARGVEQLLGAMDGLMLLGIILAVAFNIRTIWRNTAARGILLLWLGLMIVFAAGTGNYGTALRHRIKFVPVIVAVAAPFMFRRMQNRLCCESHGYRNPRVGTSALISWRSM